MKAKHTWILIADGARARIVDYKGPTQGFTQVPGLEFTGDHSATHDLVSDQQGRSFSSHGPGRSAMEPHSDPHRLLKTKFANQLADVLAREVDRYDRLVVVAAPVTLGDLRSALSDKVRAKIVGEVVQDLTKTPNGDLARHLDGVML